MNNRHHDTTTTTTTTFTFTVGRNRNVYICFMTGWAFRWLVINLLTILGDCLLCLWSALAHQPLDWFLPTVMALLVVSLLTLVTTNIRKVRV